ncbi:uncharacterized protein BDZ99DRAFT_539609 [Mytilinidion resinicola]|uniref:Protein kinase domain-containing protein n=1 Tax=Mytilinidion resinicola TaxID=574789 RepID=A0A6A6YBA4_9PEZI|nr:uncharacterized protein BDZ99DRAFT_539609 [Mytilinidion resinicola]KAF2806116.1 hypothetical protein BDZ99DRAFT_539609 [Mytilinidion resinicola]
MAEPSPDYKRLFFEEQHRRKAAELAQEEEQRRREDAERAQERIEEKTRKTTLLELLDACHTHLYSGLTVQTDATLSTRGDPANANNKLRPERILEWEDFPAQQEAIWDEVMGSEFVLERHFTSLHTLEESGEGIRQRMMSSELDLHLFQRSTLEDHISSIISQLYNNSALRRKFQLRGAIKFENHANTLSPESQLEAGIQRISVSGAPRRRSPRLQAQTMPVDSADLVATEVARSSRPRADQFCVYNTSSTTPNSEHRIAAFIIEYKAPHKLSLGYIYEGLHEMDLEEVLRCAEADTAQERFRRLIAAVITQAFSYMVQAGLEYGCVSTGEAFIFLRVPDDPRTAYYFLSVPKGDVGETTGWALDSEGANRLHLTAVGQMLAFTLQALKTPPRSHKWRAEAAVMLNSWEVVYDDLLETIPTQDAPSSEYRPPQHNQFLRMSPVQLRRRPTQTSSLNCEPAQDQYEASDQEPDPDTPSQKRPLPRRSTRSQATASNSSSSRDSRRGAQNGSGQYCTQNCLRGLVEGGPLDVLCPNVRDHGENYHRIDRRQFLVLVRQQLSEDLDTDCKPVGIPGACGVLFQVRLNSYGYTAAAKCTPIDFIHRLRREATIYEHLRPLQGVYVPVHLGNIDLVYPYFYEGITELVHMMFLSFGGELISRHITADNRLFITQQLECSAQAIHNLGVLHHDLMPRNILWNTEVGKVMVIDFERAEVVKPRAALGIISPNRKKKRASPVKQRGEESLFTRETRRAAIELRGLT